MRGIPPQQGLTEPQDGAMRTQQIRRHSLGTLDRGIVAESGHLRLDRVANLGQCPGLLLGAGLVERRVDLQRRVQWTPPDARSFSTMLRLARRPSRNS